MANNTELSVGILFKMYKFGVTQTTPKTPDFFKNEIVFYGKVENVYQNYQVPSISMRIYLNRYCLNVKLCG